MVFFEFEFELMSLECLNVISFNIINIKVSDDDDEGKILSAR